LLKNKWTHGKVLFELPELPFDLKNSSGIKPISVTLDNRIGEEVVLLITEPLNQIKNFEGVEVSDFMLKAGLVNTSFGPVCFLLYFFPDPHTGEQVTYENTINPKNQEQLFTFEKLANQEYWHVIAADDFANTFGLKETLAQVQNVCKNLQVTNFLSAKAEYEAKYSVESLLAM